MVDNDDNDHNDGRPATAIGIHHQRGANSSPTTSVPTQPIITTAADISATPSFDVDHERVVVAVVSDNNVNSDDDDGYFGDEEDVADSVVVGTNIDHHATIITSSTSPTPPLINQPKPTPARNRYGPDSEDDDDTDDEDDEEDDASPLFSRRGH